MQKTKRILLLLLVAALIVTQLPVIALATSAGEGGENIAFDMLPEEMADQTVEEPSDLAADAGSGGEDEPEPGEGQPELEEDSEQLEPEPDKPEQVIVAPARAGLNSTAVCIVNGVEFTDSDSAIQNAFYNGGTLTLLQDIDFNYSIALGVYGLEGGNRTLTIDLNNYTLNINGSLTINDSSKLYLDGEVIGEAELNINNTGQQPAVKMSFNGHAEISNISSVNHHGVSIEGDYSILRVSGDIMGKYFGVRINNYGGNQLNISGNITVVDANYGIYVHEYGGATNDITINGTIHVSRQDGNVIVAVYAYNRTNTKINGGIYRQGEAGSVTIRMQTDPTNDLHFGGGTYNAGTGYFDYSYDNSKVSIKGYALTVSAGTGGTVNAEASGPYEGGRVVNMSATSTDSRHYIFEKWTSSNGGTFANSNAASTTFIMPSNDTTVTANFTFKNTLPTLKSGVPTTASASATYGGTYTLDLSDIFIDADVDTLNYKVSLNGAGAVDIPSAIYSFTPTKAGTTTHKFLAYDDYEGYTDDNNRYLVTLITEKKMPTISDLTYSVDTKTYNGLAQPVKVAAASGITGLGEITVKYCGSTTAPKDKGAYAVTMSIAEGTNYAATTADISLGDYTISKAELTVTGIAAKPYDGTTDVSGLALTFSGLQNGESLTLDTDYTVSNGQFNSADAGNNKTLTATVALESTSLVGNYTLTSTNLNLTNQTISKATTAGVDRTLEAVKNHEEDYAFDLTELLPTIVSPQEMGAVTYTPVITENGDGVLGALDYSSGDTLTVPVQSVSEASKTATITVTVKSTNYADFDATITVKTIDTISLTITGTVVNTKIYDGNTAATLSKLPTLDDTNVQPGDKVTLEGTPSGTFDNADVGTAKNVTITGLSLTGKDAAKYSLDLSGVTGEIIAKPLANSMVTLLSSSFTYTGSVHMPGVTVKDGAKTLVEGTDYTVGYADNINAGTATVTVTGKGNYTETVSKDFTITKAALTITGATVTPKTYDGTTNALISDVTFSGLKNGETLTLGTDYTVSDAQFDSAGAGDGKTITGTVALCSTSKADNYNLDNSSLSISGQAIAKAAVPTGVNQTFEAVAGHAKDYDFDLTTLLPNVIGLEHVTYDPSITTNIEGVLGTVLDYTSGHTLSIPVKAVASNKSAIIAVTVTSSNYNNFTATITVKTVEKIPVNISGVTMTGGTYNGNPYTYIGTPEFTITTGGAPVNITNFDVLYTSADSGGYSAATAPTNAGEYRLTISVPDSNMTYTGSRSYTFTIKKRPVTIKADDQTITRGGTLPTFTYTVEGQLSGETALVGTPVISSPTADTNAAGSYSIEVNLSGISYTANYMAATPNYTEGKLTVNNPSSSGGGSPGGGSSSSGSSGATSPPAQTPNTESNVSRNTATATTTVPAAVDSSGSAIATVTNDQASDLIGRAMEEAGRLGESTPARVEINVEAPADSSTVVMIIPHEAVSQASTAGIGAVTLSSPVAFITFDANALSTVAEEATGDVTITVSKVDASSLSLEVQQRVGDRPVFDFSVTSGDQTISQFGGDVTVSVPYTPKEGEDTNAIVIYYINDLGELEIVSNCIYDPEIGSISFSTRHFSQYVVGYNKVNFKDVAESAWYSKAVGFIAAREITTGTGSGHFSPEGKLTRGQFIVMLMKAYGITPDAYPKINFADAGATYYTGYLAAAKRLSISSGVGNNMFVPEKEITRQEMFVLLYNVLKAISKLPQGNSGKSLSAFNDVGEIASWAKEAIKLLVETGTISGNGGKLSPTSTTTRAEMAQILYNLLSR